jgi:hypothetical protein
MGAVDESVELDAKCGEVRAQLDSEAVEGHDEIRHGEWTS